MLIDTKRLEDFMNSHRCSIANDKAVDIEDKIIYANSNTGRWESVFAQLEKDIILESKWDELEDVLFVENEDGDLILNEDWDEYEAGTLREDIWADMFSKYSGGSKLAEHPIYEEREEEQPIEPIKIPEHLRQQFLHRQIAIKVNNEEEQKALYTSLSEELQGHQLYKYDSEFPYYFMELNGDINASKTMQNIVKEQKIYWNIDFRNFDNIIKESYTSTMYNFSSSAKQKCKDFPNIKDMKDSDKDIDEDMER